MKILETPTSRNPIKSNSIIIPRSSQLSYHHFSSLIPKRCEKCESSTGPLPPLSGPRPGSWTSRAHCAAWLLAMNSPRLKPSSMPSIWVLGEAIGDKWPGDMWGLMFFFLWDLNRILIGFNGSDGILLRFYGFVWRFWRDFSNGFDVKWFVLGKIWLVTSNFQIYRWHFPQDLSNWTATSLTSKTYPPVKLIAMEILCISRKWSTNAGRCSSKKNWLVVR